MGPDQASYQVEDPSSRPEGGPVSRWDLWRPWAPLLAFAGLAAIAYVAVPEARSWLVRHVWWPTVVDVLGREQITIGATVVTPGFPTIIQALSAVLLVGVVVSARAWLVVHRRAGDLWADRVSIDTSFLLAVTPFLALGALWSALEAAHLFPVPFAFFFVPPFIIATLMVLVVVLMVLALWVEAPSARPVPLRFVTILFVLMAGRLFFVEVAGLTVRGAPWWGHLLSTLVGYAVFFGVTLGHRIVSHRRVLFAIGCEQLAFAGVLASLWLVEGPWQPLDWSYMGQTAVRFTTGATPSMAWVAFLPALGVTYGIYTLGSFLHTYLQSARPWTDGLNLALFFSQTLEAWIVTLGVMGPFGVPGPRWPVPAGIAGTTMDWFSGWGYLVFKMVFVLALVHVLDLTYSRPFKRAYEYRNLLKGAVLAIGLVPGVRGAMRLIMGF